MGKVLFIVVASLFIAASTVPARVCAAAEASQHSTIPRVLEISTAAYRDFESKLISRGSGSSDLERHVSSIDNYYLKIHLSGRVCIVEFTPMPLNGNSFRGGGARYVIDVESSMIQEYREYR